MTPSLVIVPQASVPRRIVPPGDGGRTPLDSPSFQGALRDAGHRGPAQEAVGDRAFPRHETDTAEAILHGEPDTEEPAETAPIQTADVSTLVQLAVASGDERPLAQAWPSTTGPETDVPVVEEVCVTCQDATGAEQTALSESPVSEVSGRQGEQEHNGTRTISDGPAARQEPRVPRQFNDSDQRPESADEASTVVRKSDASAISAFEGHQQAAEPVPPSNTLRLSPTLATGLESGNQRAPSAAARADAMLIPTDGVDAPQGNSGDTEPIRLAHFDLETHSGGSAAPDDHATMQHGSGEESSPHGHEGGLRELKTDSNGIGQESGVATGHDGSFQTHLRRSEVAPAVTPMRPIAEAPVRPVDSGVPSIRLDVPQAEGTQLQVHVSVVHQTVYARIVTSQADVQDFLTRNQARLEASLEQYGLEVGQFLVDSGPQHHGRSPQDGWDHGQGLYPRTSAPQVAEPTPKSTLPASVHHGYRLNIVV